MPAPSITCLALSFSVLLLPTLLAAQQPPNDSAALARAVSLYHDHVGDEAAIYNGRAYQPHDGNLQGGDPYFNSPLSVIGSLTFDGLGYTGVPLLFDLVRNQLIITDPKGQLLSLYNDKIQQFTIGRRRSKTPYSHISSPPGITTSSISTATTIPSIRKIASSTCWKIKKRPSANSYDPNTSTIAKTPKELR
jgi:hypothetical protein